MSRPARVASDSAQGSGITHYMAPEMPGSCADDIRDDKQRRNPVFTSARPRPAHCARVAIDHFRYNITTSDKNCTLGCDCGTGRRWPWPPRQRGGHNAASYRRPRLTAPRLGLAHPLRSLRTS